MKKCKVIESYEDYSDYMEAYDDGCGILDEQECETEASESLEIYEELAKKDDEAEESRRKGQPSAGRLSLLGHLHCRTG